MIPIKKQKIVHDSDFERLLWNSFSMMDTLRSYVNSLSNRQAAI
jgi:hypothetical protein